MGVDRVKQGVCAGVWKASRKYVGGKASVFGVLRVVSGNVADFGGDVGLGKCQPVDLTRQLVR